MEPLRVREVASLLGVTPQHVYKMLNCNQLPQPFVAPNRVIQFCPRALLQWLESRIVM